MTTKLGLYAAPVTAPASILTSISTTISINIEVAGQTAVSATKVVNLEVAGQTAVSGTETINIEVSATPIGGTVGGTPDAILNLPTYAKASRLRADFYSTNILLWPPGRTIEGIGRKVGSAPLTSITDFEYQAELDAVGSWSITIPANDEHASVILDGTAKIIRIYYEEVGLVFTGFIENYEILDSETMSISGRDMMAKLSDINTFWRLDTLSIKPNAITKRWKDYYSYVFDNFLPVYSYQYESNMPNTVVYRGNSEGEYLGIVPKYQSQTVVDVLREFNSSSGAHFRVSTVAPLVTLGEFGDDSGLIISPVGEDDPSVREEGALVLRSFQYINTKEELVNMIVVQGSNDSFGIAVELRHSSRVLSHDVEFFVPKSETNGTGGGLRAATSTATGAVAYQIIGGGAASGDLYPIDLIPTDYLSSIYEEYLNPDDGGSDTVTLAGGHVVSVYGGGSGGQRFLGVGYPEDRLAVAIPFTVTQSFYPTFASVMNMGGIGQFAMAIAPSSGGIPNMASATRLNFTNYFQNRLPGNYVQQPERSSSGNNNGFAVYTYGPIPNYIPLEDREYGVITELIGFIDLGQAGFGSNPWPLITPGDYFLVVWGTSSPRTSVSGFGSVHYGHQRDKLQLLKYNSLSSSKTALILDYSGNWASTIFVVTGSVYGRAFTSSYPYAVEGMLAESIQDNGSGHRVFYMRDVQSIRNHGLRQASVSFPNALDSSEGVNDIIPASDLLHDQAQVYLTNHSQPFERLTVTCTGLFRLPYVGQKVRFVYRGMALNENGEYKWLDINSDWYVLNIHWQINNEGLEHTLTLSNIPDDIINPRNIAADFARNLERSKNNLGELHIASRRIGDGLRASNVSTAQ